MQNFVSSDTEILIALVGRTVPNLPKYITEYSGLPTTKPTEQIIGARNHPNQIITGMLSQIARIQEALNKTNEKINKIIEQRTIVENTAVALMTAPSTPETETASTKLQEQLIKLNSAKNQLETTQSLLEDELAKVNATLAEEDSSWNQLNTKFISDLITQLEEEPRNIALTPGEKENLRKITSNDIREKRELLERSGIKKVPDFTVVAVDVIQQALGRNLQRTDDALKIAKNLPAITTVEESLELSTKKQQKILEQGEARIKSLEDEVENISGLTDEDMESLYQITNALAHKTPIATTQTTKASQEVLD